MTTNNKNIKVFVVYAPEDTALMQELQEHLSVLKRQGVISVWSEGNIEAGEDWALRKAELLAQSQLILLLISSDFLASDNLYNTAVVQAMSRHNKGNACVVPIVVRDCVWQTSAFANLVPLPKGGYPVTDTHHWQSRDAAFRNVTEGLYKLIDNFKLQNDSTYKFEKPISIDIPIYNTLKKHTPSYANIISVVFIALLSLTAAWLYWQRHNNVTQPPTPIDPVLQPIQGLWVNPNNHVVAKLLFSGNEVEVFSVAEDKNYSWGIERVSIVNSRKLSVNYADWDIKFSLTLEENRPNNVQDTLWFLYKVDTTAAPLTILNIPLVRAHIAVQELSDLENEAVDTTASAVHRTEPQQLKMANHTAMPADTNTVSLRTLNISPKRLIQADRTTPKIPNKTKPHSVKHPQVPQKTKNNVAVIAKDSTEYTITIPQMTIDLTPVQQMLLDSFQKRINYKAVRDTSISLINRFQPPNVEQ